MAGANVSVLDNSPGQLAPDRLVGEREALPLRTLEGDMRNLSELADGAFDLVFHRSHRHRDDPIAAYMSTLIATQATKPKTAPPASCTS